MNHNQDRYNDAWLDDLDAIMAGDACPPEEEKDLLHVATRLASALAPLRQTAKTVAINEHFTLSRSPSGQNWIRRQTKQKFSSAWMFVTASLLLLCLTGIGSVIGGANLWRGAHQVLQSATSLDQINGVSIASLSPPHAGLKPLPLLPAILPANTHASTYGVLTDASDPNIMTTFVADYHINGQDVQLFEQPSNVVFLSTTAQAVQIGTRQGQLFQDNKGSYALQWYQNNMLCQLTSKLPAALLISLASVFQPISSWDLLR